MQKHLPLHMRYGVRIGGKRFCRRTCSMIAQIAFRHTKSTQSIPTEASDFPPLKMAPHHKETAKIQALNIHKSRSQATPAKALSPHNQRRGRGDSTQQDPDVFAFDEIFSSPSRPREPEPMRRRSSDQIAPVAGSLERPRRMSDEVAAPIIPEFSANDQDDFPQFQNDDHLPADDDFHFAFDNFDIPLLPRARSKSPAQDAHSPKLAVLSPRIRSAPHVDAPNSSVVIVPETPLGERPRVSPGSRTASLSSGGRSFYVAPSLDAYPSSPAPRPPGSPFTPRNDHDKQGNEYEDQIEIFVLGSSDFDVPPSLDYESAYPGLEFDDDGNLVSTPLPTGVEVLVPPSSRFFAPETPLRRPRRGIERVLESDDKHQADREETPMPPPKPKPKNLNPQPVLQTAAPTKAYPDAKRPTLSIWDLSDRYLENAARNAPLVHAHEVTMKKRRLV